MTPRQTGIFLKKDSQRPIFGEFADNAKMGGIMLGNFTLLHSVVVAVILTVIVYAYLKFTKRGYEISVVGDSSATAKYAGMTSEG